MKRWRVGVGCAVLALLASTTPSFGETAVEAALRWGLVGTWKPACAAPITPFDAEYAYVARGTSLFLERDLGNSKDSSPIQNAVIQGDGTIELTIVFEAARSRRKNIMERNVDGRIRVQTNYDIDTGQYSVREGKLVSSGKETPWQTRCR